jgi:hypothetical protein
LTPSDGNSPPPLKGITLFIKRPLGKRIGEALRAMGVKVVLHSDFFGETAADTEYLARCALEGWIPLTADSDVHNSPLQKLLIREAKLQVFRLVRNHWPWAEKLAAFVAALPAIERLVRKQPGPFIARINREGKISALEDLRDQKVRPT